MFDNINFIYLITVFLILFILYDYYYTEKFNNTKETFFIDSIDDPFNSPNQRDCSIFGCSSIRASVSDNSLYIGNESDGKPVFEVNNKTYNIDNNNNLVPTFKKYNKLHLPKKIPVDIKNMKLKINLTYNDHDFIGILENKWYNQEFLLYEKKYHNSNLYTYLLVKIINNQYKIYYELPPRNKIEQFDTIWASYASFQLGPLYFK